MSAYREGLKKAEVSTRFFENPLSIETRVFNTLLYILCTGYMQKLN